MHTPNMTIPISNCLGVSNNLQINLDNFSSKYYDVMLRNFLL